MIIFLISYTKRTFPISQFIIEFCVSSYLICRFCNPIGLILLFIIACNGGLVISV